MNYNYLVPANSKKQTLIFGFLTKFDILISMGFLVLNSILFILISIVVVPFIIL